MQIIPHARAVADNYSCRVICQHLRGFLLRSCLRKVRESKLSLHQAWKMEDLDVSVRRQICSMASYRELDLNNFKRDVTVHCTWFYNPDFWMLSGACYAEMWLLLTSSSDVFQVSRII